jgi:hypothetical protein
MKKETKSTEVAKKSTQELANIAYETDAGMGFDNMGAQDVALPFYVILQSGSPQLKRGEAQVEGATEGDIFNTVTAEIFKPDKGILVVPCAYVRAYVEWVLRENGGGFVTQHPNESILTHTKKDEKGRDVLPNGNVVVTTAYYFILAITPAGYNQGMVSMTSTQLKKARKWNSIMTSIKMTGANGQKFTPPMFSHIYKLTTIPEHNEKGAWSGWQIELAEVVVDPAIYTTAKSFAEMVRAGQMNIVPPQEEPLHDDGESVPF